MAENLYTIESKILSQAITKCLSVISLGERSDTNVVTLVFSKKGLAIETINSIAEFSSDLPVKVNNGFKNEVRVSIIPELLLSYTKSYKELTLNPRKDKMDITAGKQFNATVFYIGQTEPVVRRKFKDSENISKVTKAASTIIPTISGIKNRTDGQPLGVIFSWGDSVEVTVGDTHHAIVVDAAIKTKSSNTLTTSLPNIQILMNIGNNFAFTEDRFYAYSDTEYLAMANKIENLFLADMARSVIKEGKKTTKFVVKTDEFKSVIDTITSAIAETEVVQFNIGKDKVVLSTNTSAGNAKAVIKHGGLKGKPAVLKSTIHHLRDCLSAMKEKTTTINLMENTMVFESSTKEIKISAALTIIGVN